MKYIYISSCNKNTYAMVDDEIFDYLSSFRWYLNKDLYARRATYDTGLFMHRMILEVPDGFVIDHIDRNTLNNQKSNLRIVTQGQNNQNTKSRNNSTSKYRGVSWRKKSNKWVAQACLNRKVYWLGEFDDELEAAEVAKEWRKINMPFSSQ